MSLSEAPIHGRIHTPWWQTKKIAQWEYSSPVPFDPEMVTRLGKPIIHVNLNRRSGDSGKKDVFTFSARCSWFKAAEEIAAKDLGALEEKVEARLNEIVLASAGITWNEWIEVCVKREDTEEQEWGSKVNKTSSSELSVRYTTIKRAKMPDGRDLMLDHGWSMKPFPKPKAAGVKDTNPDPDADERAFYYSSRDEDAEYTYIPSTPENIAALDAVQAMIVTAGNRLQSLLGQKAIEKTLALVASGTPLLEAPKR